MRKLLALLIAPLFFAPVADAQYSGLSAFAARSPRFPCDRYLNIVLQARYPAMAVLWDSFGDDNTCVVRFLEAAKDRPHAIQIHPWNNVAVRNRTTEPQMVFHRMSRSELNRRLEARDPVLIRELQARLAEMVNFVNAHGNVNTQCVISTGLEDNYSREAFLVMVQVVQSVWPYLVVRNPVGGSGGKYGAVHFIERHGHGARADVVNEDGNPGTLRQSRRFLDRNRGALAKFLWRPDHQGRPDSGRPDYPRSGRDFVISARDERELGDLLGDY